MTSVKYAVKLLRFHSEPETRWFRKHILRRRWRYSEEVVFSGPPPEGLMVEYLLNAPSRMSLNGVKIAGSWDEELLLRDAPSA